MEYSTLWMRGASAGGHGHLSPARCLPCSLWPDNSRPAALDDVVTLSNAGVSNAAIIEFLYSFGRHFRLTLADAWALKRKGVSPDVIDYLTSPASHPPGFLF